MFLHLSVSHSVHRWGGGSASVHAGIPPAKETPLPKRPNLPRRPPPAKDTPCQGDPPARKDPPARETPPPSPRQRGKLRGIRSRPTPKGEIEGDQIQAHIQGGN